jgi:hypothetical protein
MCSSQAALCVGVRYKNNNNGVSSKITPVSIITLWIQAVRLTAVGSGGLLYYTAQGQAAFDDHMTSLMMALVRRNT